VNIPPYYLFIHKNDGIDETMDQIRLFLLNEFNYPKFRSKILDLYLHAFTTGDYAQYIDPQRAESTLDEIVRRGTGNMAFTIDRLAGVVLALPLQHDKEFPAGEVPEIPVDTSLYIAEVMVHTDLRGRGIASMLISDLLTRAKGIYTDAVIRVWERNAPALSLYGKLGFHPVANISQTKLNAYGETFCMEKIYLHKKVL